MKKKQYLIVLGVAITVMQLSGCTNEPKDVELRDEVLVGDYVTTVSSNEIDEVSSEEIVETLEQSYCKTQEFADYIVGLAQEQIAEMQIVPAEKLGRKYALLYNGCYYDFLLTDNQDIDVNACEIYVDEDTFNASDADLYDIWSTVRLRLKSGETVFDIGESC